MKETDIHTRYEILDQIGRGSYASVHKAINKQTGEICAIKKISTESSEVKNLITEISIMRNCECKNIVRYLESNLPNVEEVLIVMEYCCGGSVKDAMRHLNRTITAEQITVIIRDVLCGLDYLHKGSRIHRDVKAANILLNEKGIAKLGDFGVSETLGDFELSENVSRNQRVERRGTPLWLPPEVIREDPEYSFAVDIWSLGITIIEMGDGQPPYSELNDVEDALKEIANYSKPSASFRDNSKWPQNLVEFTALCLEKDARRRKSANELLKTDLITNVVSNEPIKQLVAEVCTSTVKQNESSLAKRAKSLLTEHSILYRVYEERKKRVIKVDQMSDSYTKMLKEYEDLLGSIRKHHNEYRESKEMLRRVTEETKSLERLRNELDFQRMALSAELAQQEDKLNKINEEIQKESRLINKLRSLEGK